MNTLRFNRHKLFTNEMMDYHMNRNESWFTSLYNMLCGVWDGYLYTEMLETAKQMGLPTHITNRIQFTESFINK